MKILRFSSLLLLLAAACITTDKERAGLEADNTDDVEMSMKSAPTEPKTNKDASTAGTKLVVIAKNVKAHSKPNEQSPETASLERWQDVTVTKTENGWSYVKDAGWVKSDLLGE